MLLPAEGMAHATPSLAGTGSAAAAAAVLTGERLRGRAVETTPDGTVAQVTAAPPPGLSADEGIYQLGDETAALLARPGIYATPPCA